MRGSARTKSDFFQLQDAKLKAQVRRIARPWVEAWRSLPDAERLTQSLLKGIEFRLLQRRGDVPSPYSVDPVGNCDRMAFSRGQQLADDIPEHLVDALFVNPVLQVP